MKALYIPLLVLIGMLSFALWTGGHVTKCAEAWNAALREADDLAQQEQWEAVESTLRRSYDSWNESQTFFHTIIAHEELDAAEGLFAAAFAACDVQDVPDFHTTLAELMSKLTLLAETQEISIKNIL